MIYLKNFNIESLRYLETLKIFNLRNMLSEAQSGWYLQTLEPLLKAQPLNFYEFYLLLAINYCFQFYSYALEYF